MRRFAFVAITLLVGGCSLFVDLDGLSGAAAGAGDVFVPDGNTFDAPGTDASDASAVDAAHFTCPD
ncbi:MAG: hypothetical protein ACRELY_07120, partial [Polyangiaceae bacterium]